MEVHIAVAVVDDVEAEGPDWVFVLAWGVIGGMNANLVPFELEGVMVLLPVLVLGKRLWVAAGLGGWRIAILAVRVVGRGPGVDTLPEDRFVVEDMWIAGGTMKSVVEDTN